MCQSVLNIKAIANIPELNQRDKNKDKKKLPGKVFKVLIKY